MTIALCCDARVVDNATAARWLSVLKSYMENPAVLLSDMNSVSNI